MLRPLEPGDPPLVGRYALLGRLGSGGMGAVFLGRSPGGRLVAVKVIRPELASDPDFRARFAREVSAARLVSGFFTAPVVDADPGGPQPWLVTAYVPGPSLEEAVAAHGPLPVASVLALAAGLAEGLGAIHAVGLVHRDLKPSNVLLAGDGPRIIDFGISRAVDATAATLSGMLVGSPLFMSPEQAEGREIGPPSDVFSLGGVLMYAATGQGPFGAGTPAALLYRVVHAEPETGALPGRLVPLVERCLAKDPAARPGVEEILAETGGPHLPAGWLPEPVSHALERYAQPAQATAPATGAPTLTAHTLTAPGLDGQAGSPPAGAAVGAAAAGAGLDPASQMTLRQAQPLGEPGRRRRWMRWALAGGAAVVVLAAGSVALALTAPTTAAPAKRSSAARASAPLAGRAGSPVQGSSSTAVQSPRAVVEAYLAALNARNWPKVWRLGARNFGGSYRTMVAGYRQTSHDVITHMRVSGGTVVVRILAYETTGAVQTYRIRYTVRNGQITAGSQTLLATAYPSAPAGGAAGCPHIQYGADGTAGPLFCANGQPNPPVLAYYQSSQLMVMALGPNATPGQVLNAMCTDLPHSTLPIETDAYLLAQRINGWSFGVDPAQELRDGACSK